MNEVDPIRVLIVDDEELVRSGLRLILQRSGGFRVVGEAADGVEAVEACQGADLDVVLLDIRMPRMDGIQATAQILRDDDPPAVMILTTFGLDEYVYSALEVGAVGFLPKDTPARELVDALIEVAAGRPVLSQPAVAAVVRRFAQRQRPGLTRDEERRLATLTDRERHIMATLVDGGSNAEIAELLFVSESTVKTHVGRILQKLGLTNRVQAAILAHRAGIN